jgi:hypothetical protein
MRGHFADARALERLVEAGNPVLYEVFEKAVPAEHGHLQVCISLTRAGTAAEFPMRVFDRGGKAQIVSAPR